MGQSLTFVALNSVENFNVGNTKKVDQFKIFVSNKSHLCFLQRQKFNISVEYFRRLSFHYQDYRYN
jgi:hypothetical protein